MSDQNQGYFAFRFVCLHCYWQIDTPPIRSKIATTTNIMDIGLSLQSCPLVLLEKFTFVGYPYSSV